MHGMRAVLWTPRLLRAATAIPTHAPPPCLQSTLTSLHTTHSYGISRAVVHTHSDGSYLRGSAVRYHRPNSGMFQMYRQARAAQSGGGAQGGGGGDGVRVCSVDELTDGESREVEVGSGRVLVARDQGQYYAVGAKCSHYGAPLSKGVVCNGRVRCPWHGACFSLKTGDIEDFPGLDSIPTYEVRVVGDEVRLMVTEEQMQPIRRVKKRASHDKQSKETYVIVGGGAAAATCAETLRQEGFTGRVLVLTREPHVPYDRPKLSKALNMSAKDLALRSAEDLAQTDIEYRFNATVEGVDSKDKKVRLSGGETVQYDKLCIATGAIPRQATFIKNHDLKNIYTLRTPEDANAIASAGKGKHVLIIGTSFIGLEAAAYLTGKAASVQVVGRAGTVLQESMGSRVGRAVQQLLEDKGVQFYFENSVSEFTAHEDGSLSGAILKDGRTLQADMCVVGIGVTPATDFLKDSGLDMNKGFLQVNKHLETSAAHVFAAGDVTQFPLFMAEDERVNVQHWQMALKQGHVAALNMLGRGEEIRSVPFFWTVLFGKSLRYCGYGPGYDDVVIHGELDKLTFVAYYTKGERVVAVASLNKDPLVAQAAELFLSGQTLSKTEVKDDEKAWTARLCSAK